MSLFSLRSILLFRSFSKTAGFTGLRCAYTVVPSALKVRDAAGSDVQLKPLWNRRQCTKYNGCPYIVQKAAEAAKADKLKKERKQRAEEVNSAYKRYMELLNAFLQDYGSYHTSFRSDDGLFSDFFKYAFTW